eukprot:3043518-Pyramimonas_sp.AAC.1
MPSTAAPEPAGPRNFSKRAQSCKQSYKQSPKPTVDRATDCAARRARAGMKRKMSNAAAT